jgi:hypothetical protein
VPDTNIFKTDRLNTAVYLHASKLLPYVGIRRVNHFKLEFVSKMRITRPLRSK